MAQIGTDPAQANVLVNRTVDTAGSSKGTVIERTNGLGLNQSICGQNTQQDVKNTLLHEDKTVGLVDGVLVTDGGNISFAYALGAMVQQTIDAWFVTNGITDPVVQDAFNGGRPNCLQSGQGYKARPLNGVWSTAPFLHNNSVANISELVCMSQAKRAKYVRLGAIQFDQKNLGILQPEGFQKTAEDYVKETDQGFFILDTSLPANSNLGHSFSDKYDSTKHYSKQLKGVIDPAIDAQHCDALIDFLKTI